MNALFRPLTSTTIDTRNPHTWLQQVRRVFHVRDISKQEMMFHHTLSALPTNAVSQVAGRAPEDKMYTTLKSAFIRLLSGSLERRLQQPFLKTECKDVHLRPKRPHFSTLDFATDFPSSSSLASFSPSSI